MIGFIEMQRRAFLWQLAAVLAATCAPGGDRRRRRRSTRSAAARSRPVLPPVAPKPPVIEPLPPPIEVEEKGFHFRGARVRHDSTQSVNSGSNKTLSFDTEDYDVGGFHDTVVNNSRLVAPVAGYYHITAQVMWSDFGLGDRLLGISHSVDGVIGQNLIFPGDTVNGFTQNIGMDYYLAAGQYVVCFVWQDSGAVLSILRSVKLTPVFCIHRIG